MFESPPQYQISSENVNVLDVLTLNSMAKQKKPQERTPRAPKGGRKEIWFKKNILKWDWVIADKI